MELLYFGKWNFLGPRLKNFQRKLSRLEKQKKSYPKIFLIFHEVEFFSPKLKELLFFFLKKLFYFRRGLSENQKFLINKKFLIFSIFFFLKIKSPVFFFHENPLWIFTTVFFFQVFSFFTTVFWSFHCWLHFFWSSFFFALTVSFGGFVRQILLFCVVILRVLQTWESLLYSQSFFTLYSFPTFVMIPQVLQIWDRFFLPPEVFYFTFLYDIINLFQVLNQLFNSYICVKCMSYQLDYINS